MVFTLEVEIRDATPEDAVVIRTLEQQVPTAAHWSEHDYARVCVTDGRSFVALIAEEAGKVCGFLVGACVGPEWEIENVVVEKSARRRGTGSQLVQEYLRRARESAADAVFLEVRESNCAARELYLKCGFREFGRRKNYYADPAEDAIISKCDLSDNVVHQNEK